MRPWASWTAKTAMLAVGFAAAAGGLSGVALAGTGGSAGSGNGSVLSINRLTALADVTAGRTLEPAVDGAAGSVVRHAMAPVASALGATRPLAGLQPVSGLAPLAGLQPVSGLAPLAGLQPVSGLAPLSAVTGGDTSALGATGPGGMSAQGTSSAFDNTSGAVGAGDTNVPAASQLVGLGALPGLADLPSLAGLANMPALNGLSGGGIPMPGTALSAVNISGMSSDSFAALAVGALLAGASALIIAGRRTRDRKAGIGVTI